MSVVLLVPARLDEQQDWADMKDEEAFLQGTRHTTVRITAEWC